MNLQGVLAFTVMALVVAFAALALILGDHMRDHDTERLRLLDRNVYLQQRIIDLPGCVREREA